MYTIFVVYKGQVKFDSSGSRIVDKVEFLQYRIRSSTLGRVYFGFSENVNESDVEFYYKPNINRSDVFPCKCIFRWPIKCWSVFVLHCDCCY